MKTVNVVHLHMSGEASLVSPSSREATTRRETGSSSLRAGSRHGRGATVSHGTVGQLIHERLLPHLRPGRRAFDPYAPSVLPVEQQEAMAFLHQHWNTVPLSFPQDRVLLHLSQRALVFQEGHDTLYAAAFRLAHAFRAILSLSPPETTLEGRRTCVVFVPSPSDRDSSAAASASVGDSYYDDDDRGVHGTSAAIDPGMRFPSFSSAAAAASENVWECSAAEKFLFLIALIWPSSPSVPSRVFPAAQLAFEGSGSPSRAKCPHLQSFMALFEGIAPVAWPWIDRGVARNESRALLYNAFSPFLDMTAVRLHWKYAANQKEEMARNAAAATSALSSYSRSWMPTTPGGADGDAPGPDFTADQAALVCMCMPFFIAELFGISHMGDQLALFRRAMPVLQWALSRGTGAADGVADKTVSAWPLVSPDDLAAHKTFVVNHLVRPPPPPSPSPQSLPFPHDYAPVVAASGMFSVWEANIFQPGERVEHGLHVSTVPAPVLPSLGAGHDGAVLAWANKFTEFVIWIASDEIGKDAAGRSVVNCQKPPSFSDTEWRACMTKLLRFADFEAARSRPGAGAGAVRGSGDDGSRRRGNEPARLLSAEMIPFAVLQTGPILNPGVVRDTQLHADLRAFPDSVSDAVGSGSMDRVFFLPGVTARELATSWPLPSPASACFCRDAYRTANGNGALLVCDPLSFVVRNAHELCSYAHRQFPRDENVFAAANAYNPRNSASRTRTAAFLATLLLPPLPLATASNGTTMDAVQECVFRLLGATSSEYSRLAANPTLQRLSLRTLPEKLFGETPGSAPGVAAAVKTAPMPKSSSGVADFAAEPFLISRVLTTVAWLLLTATAVYAPMMTASKQRPAVSVSSLPPPFEVRAYVHSHFLTHIQKSADGPNLGLLHHATSVTAASAVVANTAPDEQNARTANVFYADTDDAAMKRAGFVQLARSELVNILEFAAETTAVRAWRVLATLSVRLPIRRDRFELFFGSVSASPKQWSGVAAEIAGANTEPSRMTLETQPGFEFVRLGKPQPASRSVAVSTASAAATTAAARARGDSGPGPAPCIAICLHLCGAYTHLYARSTAAERLDETVRAAATAAAVDASSTSDIRLLRSLTKASRARTLCVTPAFASDNYHLLRSVVLPDLPTEGAAQREDFHGPVSPLFHSLRPDWLQSGTPIAQRVMERLQSSEDARRQQRLAEAAAAAATKKRSRDSRSSSSSDNITSPSYDYGRDRVQAPPSRRRGYVLKPPSPPPIPQRHRSPPAVLRGPASPAPSPSRDVDEYRNDPYGAHLLGGVPVPNADEIFYDPDNAGDDRSADMETENVHSRSNRPRPLSNPEPY